MKTLIIFSLAIAATLASEQWTQFKATHSKVYSNAVEEVRRMAIFQDNLAKIEAHNELYKKGEVTHSKAMNQFGDWTKEEFLEYVNRGKLTRPQRKESEKMTMKAPKAPAADSVDWRGRATTEVKNQGQCGSCWSFSATGALEGALALYNNQLVSLSEQNLIDCSGSYGNAACNGGWMGSAFDYIRDNGIMSEADYPYEAQLGNCRFDAGRSVARVTQYFNVPANEGDLATYVSSYGPIAVAIDATDELQFYSGGVLYDDSCNERDLNHGVLVVGYGSDGGNDYWIVKNSWGSGWGDGGYYYSARNRGDNCGIATSGELPATY